MRAQLSLSTTWVTTNDLAEIDELLGCGVYSRQGLERRCGVVVRPARKAPAGIANTLQHSNLRMCDWYSRTSNQNLKAPSALSAQSKSGEATFLRVQIAVEAVPRMFDDNFWKLICGSCTRDGQIRDQTLGRVAQQRSLAIQHRTYRRTKDLDNLPLKFEAHARSEAQKRSPKRHDSLPFPLCSGRDMRSGREHNREMEGWHNAGKFWTHVFNGSPPARRVSKTIHSVFRTATGSRRKESWSRTRKVWKISKIPCGSTTTKSIT